MCGDVLLLESGQSNMFDVVQSDKPIESADCIGSTCGGLKRPSISRLRCNDAGILFQLKEIVVFQVTGSSLELTSSRSIW